MVLFGLTGTESQHGQRSDSGNLTVSNHFVFLIIKSFLLSFGFWKNAHVGQSTLAVLRQTKGGKKGGGRWQPGGGSARARGGSPRLAGRHGCTGATALLLPQS